MSAFKTVTESGKNVMLQTINGLRSSNVINDEDFAAFRENIEKIPCKPSGMRFRKSVPPRAEAAEACQTCQNEN